MCLNLLEVWSVRENTLWFPLSFHAGELWSYSHLFLPLISCHVRTWMQFLAGFPSCCCIKFSTTHQWLFAVGNLFTTSSPKHSGEECLSVRESPCILAVCGLFAGWLIKLNLITWLSKWSGNMSFNVEVVCKGIFIFDWTSFIINSVLNLVVYSFLKSVFDTVVLGTSMGFFQA